MLGRICGLCGDTGPKGNGAECGQGQAGASGLPPPMDGGMNRRRKYLGLAGVQNKHLGDHVLLNTGKTFSLSINHQYQET